MKGYKMQIISRNHNFENRLTYIQKGRKYFYLWHEKSANPVKVKITNYGLHAFDCQQWSYFESKEAQYFGGSI